MLPEIKVATHKIFHLSSALVPKDQWPTHARRDSNHCHFVSQLHPYEGPTRTFLQEFANKLTYEAYLDACSLLGSVPICKEYHLTDDDRDLWLRTDLQEYGELGREATRSRFAIERRCGIYVQTIFRHKMYLGVIFLLSVDPGPLPQILPSIAPQRRQLKQERSVYARAHMHQGTQCLKSVSGKFLAQISAHKGNFSIKHSPRKQEEMTSLMRSFGLTSFRDQFGSFWCNFYDSCRETWDHCGGK